MRKKRAQLEKFGGGGGISPSVRQRAGDGGQGESARGRSMAGSGERARRRRSAGEGGVAAAAHGWRTGSIDSTLPSTTRGMVVSCGLGSIEDPASK